MQIINDTVLIKLSGKKSDPLFWWSLLLMILGVVVAVLCMILPVAYAIGALFVFAVAMFFFNIQRHKNKQRHLFFEGELKLTPYRFEIDGKSVSLSQSAQITQQNLELLVVDRGIHYHFVGFCDENEAQIAQRVLMGQKVASRAVQIRLQNSDS